jgi:hypothetical protein
LFRIEGNRYRPDPSGVTFSKPLAAASRPSHKMQQGARLTLAGLEHVTDDLRVARRNLALGLWAGRLIGLKGPALHSYVQDVMRSDRDIPGPDDVIDKIARDFVEHGIELMASDIERRLLRQECLACGNSSHQS